MTSCMYARITENDHSANFDMDYINLQKKIEILYINIYISFGKCGTFLLSSFKQILFCCVCYAQKY